MREIESAGSEMEGPLRGQFLHMVAIQQYHY